MSEELEVLKLAIDLLGKANIPYMISGSMALNYYALPRMTRDIDIVIELKEEDINNFVFNFENDFMVDEEMIREDVRQSGMFNLIHNKYVFKVDFIIRKRSLYGNEAFNRRRNVLIDDCQTCFISPEDLVISKLDWARSGGSEMQLKDVKNLLQMVEGLDTNYIERWASDLGLSNIYNKAKI